VPPPLVFYQTSAEYRAHYQRVYCQEQIFTADGVRVFFGPRRFDHAFYKSSRPNGPKDTFSIERARRIDWIRYALQEPTAQLFFGWNKATKQTDHGRRVSVVVSNYVVVVEMGLTANNRLKAQFTTAYVADRSIEKIVTGPPWSQAECLELLLREKGIGR